MHGHISPEISEWEKFDRYVRGLKPRVRREVELRDVTTFTEAAKIAEKVDSNLDRVFNQQPRANFNPGSRRNDGPNPPGPVPMELGAMKKLDNKSKTPSGPRGPLTDAEKQYRRDHHLCLYCGAKDHSVEDCPVRPRRPFKPKQGNGVGRPPSGAGN